LSGAGAVHHINSVDAGRITMTMTCRGSKSLIEKIQLSTDDVDKITAFLDSLTGEQPKVTYPVLPPSVGATPRPQP
jgi:hypothetical protein